MSFQNYKSANLASGTIKTGISAGVTSLILATGQGDLFPSNYPYFLKIEKYDSGSLLENKPVTKREIVKVTNKSGDTFTITRSAGYCPATSTATTQTNTAYSFDVGDSVFLVMPAEQITDIQDEVARLETDKADDADVVHKTGNESIAGVKTFLSSPIVPVAVNATEAVNKSQLDSSILSSQSPEAIYEIEKYIMGEAGSAGESVMPEVGTTFALATGVQNVGDVTANTRTSIPVFGNGVGFNTLKLSLKKTLSPSADISIRIEEDDGTGKASGTIYDPIATATLLAGAVTTSFVDTTFTFSGSTVSNAHGVTLNVNETSKTGYRGIKVTLTQQVSVISVTKVAACTATTAYIHDINGSLLASASFSGNVATLNYTGLVLGDSYYVSVGSGGSSYTSVKQTGLASYPYVLSRMDFEEGVIMPETFIDDASTTQNSSGPNNVETTFTVSTTCKLKSIDVGVTATTGGVGLYASNGTTLIESGTAGGVFGGNTILTAGTTYVIKHSINIGGQNVGIITTGNTNLPYTGDNVTITSAEVTSAIHYDLATISITTERLTTENTDINNIVSISSGDNIYIPDGQLVHIVAYVGAYGAETINASNYYNIGYSTNHTTTRPMRTYNGSVWSSALNSQFAYVSSAGLHDIVFTKTDADYTYKLPVDGPRLLTQVTAMGQKPIVTRRFLNNVLSGMTRLTRMFLANTPGAISATPGTNRYCIGIAKSETELEVGTEYYGYGDGLTILSSDSEITNTNTTLTKVKEIISNSQFTWNVYFEIKTNTTTGGKQGEGRIYVNGVAVGTLRTINTSAYASYNEYITVNAGDLIQIYARVNDNSAGYTVYIKNFRLRASVVTTRDNIGNVII